MLERDVLETSPGVRWDDVAGLTEAKRLLEEAVVLPLWMPEYFQVISNEMKNPIFVLPKNYNLNILLVMRHRHWYMICSNRLLSFSFRSQRQFSWALALVINLC